MIMYMSGSNGTRYGVKYEGEGQCPPEQLTALIEEGVGKSFKGAMNSDITVVCIGRKVKDVRKVRQFRGRIRKGKVTSFHTF